MSRLRAKIDKEIENKDIKKKLRNVQARVHSNLLYNPNQTNFDKSGSITGKNSARRSNMTRSNNSLQHSDRRSSPPSPRNRLTPHRQTIYDDPNTYPKNVNSYLQPKQPLSMYMSSTFSQKLRATTRQKKSKTKASILPAISDNEPVEEVDKSSRSSKSVRELYTPRDGDSLSSSSSDVQSRPSSSRIPVRNVQIKKFTTPAHSSFSSRDGKDPPSPSIDLVSLSSGSTTYLNLDLDLCSLSSPKSTDEVYHVAPLIPAPSAHLTVSSVHAQKDSSATLIRKFRNILAREEHSMPEDDMKVVKNVLKTDKRVNLLNTTDPDSNLFKDILQTQLHEIVKSEKVVSNALRMLGTPTHQVIEMSTPIEVYNVAPIPIEQRDNRRSSSPQRKVKRVQHTLSTPESSPRGHSSFECESNLSGSGKRRNVATDTFSMKGSSSHRSEVMSAFAEKRSPRKAKSAKIIANAASPNAEFEAFVKSTLPLKRKSTSPCKTLEQQVIHRHQCLNDENMGMKIVRGFSEEQVDATKNKDARRPQVDVTFKNVHSVEKEILILKALGRRLEETLKRSVSEPSLTESGEKDAKDELQPCSSTSSLTRELQRIDPSIEVFPGRRNNERTPITFLPIVMDVLPWVEPCVGFIILALGHRLELGIVNEFVIISKTVNELLNESISDYFIANENEPGGLEQPIPFQKVVEQPRVLMQYLKPKSPEIQFNFLDQDSLFFNSFLLPGLRSKMTARTERVDAPVNAVAELPLMENLKILEFEKKQELPKTCVYEMKQEQPKVCEGGDSLLAATDGLIVLKQEPSCSKYGAEKVDASRRMQAKKMHKVKPKTMELPVSATTSQRAVQRVRMRRVVTPMPSDAFDDPKNNLVKTILVGAVQVSIFLVMIMAITYPDIKC